MSNFLSFEDTAKQLGISTEKLTEMISNKEIFGVRDGTSWKFKPEELQRVQSELSGDFFDDDPAGSSFLLSDSTMDSAINLGGSSDADEPASLSSGLDSELSIVPDSSMGSDVRLVASSSSTDAGDLPSKDDESELKLVDDDDLVLAQDDDDDDELSLDSNPGDDILSSISGSGVGSKVDSDIVLGSDSDKNLNLGSDIELADSYTSDLVLADDSPNVNALSDSDFSLKPESDLITGDSDMGELKLAGSDLELTDDGDILLGSGSDLAIGGDSGINLMAPGDSGISLEDEPLDLAASGISGLELAGSGSDVAGASGSGIDFPQDEDFQLSPADAIEVEEDSGSQVIELEDSSEFGDAGFGQQPDGGFGGFNEMEGGASFDDASFGEVAPAAAAVAMGTPEVPYSVWEVLVLLATLLIMCLSGMLATDIARNMWAWSDSNSDLTSGFTSAIVSAFGLGK